MKKTSLAVAFLLATSNLAFGQINGVAISYDFVPPYYSPIGSMAEGQTIGLNTDDSFVALNFIEGGQDYQIYPKSLAGIVTPISHGRWREDLVTDDFDLTFVSAKTYLVPTGPGHVTPSGPINSWAQVDSLMNAMGAVAACWSKRPVNIPGQLGPAVPVLSFTKLPLLGSRTGQVAGLAFNHQAGQKIVVLLGINNGFWQKGIVTLNTSGLWSVDTNQGGQDGQAQQIYVCLYSGADPVDAAGGPLTEINGSLASLLVKRQPMLEITSADPKQSTNGLVKGRVMWVLPELFQVWLYGNCARLWYPMPDYSGLDIDPLGQWEGQIAIADPALSYLSANTEKFKALLLPLGQTPNTDCQTTICSDLPLEPDGVWSNLFITPEALPKLSSISVPFFIDLPKR